MHVWTLAMRKNLQRVATVGHALFIMLALNFDLFRLIFPVQRPKSKHGHATQRILRGESFPWARLIHSQYPSRSPQCFIRLMFCGFRVFPNHFVPYLHHKNLAIYGFPPDEMYLVLPSVLSISRSHNIFR